MVVKAASNSTNRDLGTTTSSTETGSTNWLIGNGGSTSTNGGTTWSFSSSSSSLRLQVNATTGAAKTLTAGKIEATSARITITGHTTAWYYKKTSPTPAGSCAGPVASGTAFKDLTGLTANTSYTYEAFSDSTCATGNKLATATFTTAPAAPNWGGTSTTSISYKGIAKNAGNGQLTYNTFQSGGLLELQSIFSSISSLRVRCATGTTREMGWYKRGALTTRLGGATYTSRGVVDIVDYTPTETGDYVPLAYCTRGTGMSKVYSTPLYLLSGTSGVTLAVNTTGLTLSATTLSPTNAQLELGGHTGAWSWWYKKTSPTPAGSCTSAGVFPTEYVDLSAGTSYTYKAYSDSGCTTEIGSTSFTTKLAKPTLTTSVLTIVTCGKDVRNRPTGTAVWSERFAFGSNRTLTGQITPGTIICATGTTLEVGWYSETDLTDREGVYQSVGSGLYVLAKLNPPAGRYRALAYCTKGTGSSKVYSAPVNLMRGGGVGIFGAPSAAQSAPTGTSATPGADAYDSWVVLHWDPVAEATHYEYRYKPTGGNWVRGGRWFAVLTQAHDNTCTWPCHRVRGLGSGVGYTFQVRALKANVRAWEWTSPASAEFDTTTIARGASDPLANLPAEVTLSTCPRRCRRERR